MGIANVEEIFGHRGRVLLGLCPCLVNMWVLHGRTLFRACRLQMGRE